MWSCASQTTNGEVPVLEGPFPIRESEIKNKNYN